MTAATPKAEQDVAAIRAIRDALAAACRARNALAIGRHCAPGARITDIAPPLLRRGLHPEGVQTWLDGCDGPVDIAIRDLVVEVDGALAVAHRRPVSAAPRRVRPSAAPSAPSAPSLRQDLRHSSGVRADRHDTE